MALVCWCFVIITISLIQNLKSETRYCNGGSCVCTYDGVCSLNCQGKDICKGSDVILGCRAGYPCIVHCDSNGEENACEDAIVDGTLASAVYVFCTDTQSCLNMQVKCGSGECRVICTGTGFNGNSCNGINLNCARSWCSLECQKPVDVPERSTCSNAMITVEPTTREFACLRPGIWNKECDIIDQSLMPFKFTTYQPTPQTANPTKAPSNIPTMHTLFPTRTPTNSPTNRPSLHPTNFPSKAPSLSPTSPTKFPTISPTNPTKFPTASPIRKPTNHPSISPTNNPSKNPTKFPTISPTPRPTPDPASDPTLRPSNYPTIPPSRAPTPTPSKPPTKYPTRPPTKSPTKYPTHPPTPSPTSPSYTPSRSPTLAIPTPKPTGTPTIPPTTAPTHAPTKTPSAAPSLPPTIAPTGTPTKTPSNAPTIPPTMAPTQVPTMPTREPTIFYYVVDYIKSPTKAAEIDDIITDDNNFSTPEVLDIMIDNWIYAAIAGGITLCCFVLICTRCCKRCRQCGKRGNKKIAPAAGARKQMQHVRSSSKLKLKNGKKGSSPASDAQSSNEHFIPPPPLEPPPEDLVREHHKRRSSKLKQKISIELMKADNSSLNEGIQALPLNETSQFLSFDTNGPKPAYVNDLEDEQYTHNDEIDLINLMIDDKQIKHQKHNRKESKSKNLRKKSHQQRQLRRRTSTVNSVSGVDFDIPEMEIEPSQIDLSEIDRDASY